LHPYRDQGGVWTIGWGFTYDLHGNPVTATTAPMTQAQADGMLVDQVRVYGDAVLSSVTNTLNQNQFDACTSLCYNIGAGAFKGSSVCKEINNGNFSAAADNFLKWDKIAGIANPDLTFRRKKERALFLS
jgi:lysozyme